MNRQQIEKNNAEILQTLKLSDKEKEEFKSFKSELGLIMMTINHEIKMNWLSDDEVVQETKYLAVLKNFVEFMQVASPKAIQAILKNKDAILEAIASRQDLHPFFLKKMTLVKSSLRKIKLAQATTKVVIQSLDN